MSMPILVTGCPLCATELICVRVQENGPDFTTRWHLILDLECAGCGAKSTVVTENMKAPAIKRWRDSLVQERYQAKAISDAVAEVVRLVEAAPDPLVMTPELIAARDRLRALRGTT